MSGIEMSIDARQLESLHARFGKHQGVLTSELRGAESDGLAVIRDEARSQARDIATDGRLPASIGFETISGGLEGIVGSVAKTAGSIASGRRPGEQPSAELLADWVGRRGLAAGERYSVKTRRRLRPNRATRSAEIALAWKIAMTIKQHGTKPLPLITGAAAVAAHRVEGLFSEAIGRAMAKLVRA